MGSKTTQTNTPGWSAPPSTQATQNLQGMVNQGVAYDVPIRNSYARAQQNLSRSYQNPLGAFTTADVRDKSMRSQQNDLSQSEGIDLSNAAQQNAQGQFSRQATVAGLTAPQMYNAQSVSARPFSLGDGIGLGASLGSSLLT